MFGLARLIVHWRVLGNVNVPCFLRSLHNRDINYYDVLGVDFRSDPKDIKIAYFKMARKFHPDTNKTVDAKQMFELVAEAYDVLSDAERKREYDETGAAFERFGGRAQGPQRQRSDSTYTAEQMYSRIFQSVDTEGEESNETAGEDFAINFIGADISKEYVLNLSTEQSITGARCLMNVRVSGVCDKCLGNKAEQGYAGRSCPYCEGTGEETIRTGHIVGRKQCSYCNGSKIFYKFKCIECQGIGRRIYSRPYYVDIPAGVVHGQVFKYELEADKLKVPEYDFPVRFLYVTLNVEESKVFKRDGLDVHSHVRLSPAIALLGGKIEYNGLTRSCDLIVTAGTSSHTTLIIDQAGINLSSGVSGDHVLQSVIRVPKKLGWRQSRLLKRYAQLEVPDNGIVYSVGHQLSHKYSINVLTPDNVRNDILMRSLYSYDKPTLFKQLMKKVKEIVSRFMF